MTTRLGQLPVALGVSGVVLVVSVVAGWAAGAGVGALGAAAGVALVVASYLVSSVALAWADSISPRLVLPVGLATYVIKFMLLGVVMLAILSTGWAGTASMGVAIIAGIIGWMGANLWWALRRPTPTNGLTIRGQIHRISGEE